MSKANVHNRTNKYFDISVRLCVYSRQRNMENVKTQKINV